MDNEIVSSWHQGELAVQQRAGTDERMAEIGPKFIREFMPQQHRDFFQSLSMIFVGYTGHCSNAYASVLFGAPGFIQSPTETELVMNTQSTIGDFIIEDLREGDHIGLVGIEFDTKRRNRINGIITDINQKNIKVKVLQSYGNCPKYIQPKEFAPNRSYSEFTTVSLDQLSQKYREIISSADTFFIASSFDDGQKFRNRGVDVSHRGGEVGFVSINAAGQLLVDDYVGNGFFNTLGNLLENPIASLLFCDWQTGHVLKIAVSSEILWHDEQQDSVVLAAGKVKRSLCFTPIKIEQFNNGLAYIQQF
ncbi:pyridoxamine 5'-phosphate oxidase family protein [Colwellia sp. Bg11-28]|uniref:pyridoxamine 5'-phosphate oxidase family protein n=1 Tax=Colwellia sp. Bg11-28 TaxID=2058305 RepID=UPI000C342143|nr:pyridoxamine 5'-phosphate oxidase family protein [Colwellia sp. Bg11-28]PKH88560.1 flavin-nucleotide-binding protein [Colwellia sp. Bg11-28]